MFQRSRAHATHSLPVQPPFANIHTRASSQHVNNGRAKPIRWESRWIRNFLQPLWRQQSKNTVCPPRWMSALGGHTKPRHPKRCQKIRDQRSSPTVLVTSPSVNWKDNIDDHAQCHRQHWYFIRCLHLIPHPTFQPVHRQFIWHLPQQIDHITDSRLSTVHSHNHKHGLEYVSEVALCTGTWPHASK